MGSDTSGPRDVPGRPAAVERLFEFSLLGLLTSGYLAVAGSGALDLPTLAATGIAIVLRALMAAGVLRLRISDTAVTAATLCYIAFYPLDYFYLSREFLAATVHLVFYLLVVKVLTARTARDYVFVKIVAFLELLAASVLSTSLSFFVFLAFFLVFGVATFTSSEIRRSTRKHVATSRAGLRSIHVRLTALSLVIAMGILGMTAGLFFLLPRTARAAFQHFASQKYRLPGFSNEVTLGEIGEIKRQSTPVMHVRIEGNRSQLHLKWRGAALAEFDGKRWYNSNNGGGEIVKVEKGIATLVQNPQRWRAGPRISYNVILKSIASDTLFLAGTPEFLQVQARTVIRTPTDSYQLGYGAGDGMRYIGHSFLGSGPTPEPAAPLTPAARNLYTSLPATDARILQYAAEIASGLRTDAERARAIEHELRTRYGYTIELPEKELANPISDFLFHRRKGHCEYFASSMAVMLRTLKIPARVVTGFQSGLYNPISGWYVIRASDAHSWVEAYLPGRGWTTFDPTPPDPGAGAISAWTRLMLYFDAADIFWQEWVLNYDRERQLTLASRMERGSRDLGLSWFTGLGRSLTEWRRQAVELYARWGRAVIIGLVLLTALIFAAPRLHKWWRARRRVQRVQRGLAEASDATLLYNRMLALLKRKGFEKPPWLTPAEFVRVLPVSPTAALVEELTSAYNELRFGRNTDAAARMMSALERLERPAG
ncbi:MAG: DUF3488 and transglutaminase-like domain-containing protein [Bryobacterales bacterium]|nr:DUF3488 and transglutaminase-like domain-containing protein [Bryobacterales bacterium]MEB2361316.1 DUF3488 and transglutaminase-like domain-containing protein [Bryobacterales bacterium]